MQEDRFCSDEDLAAMELREMLEHLTDEFENKKLSGVRQDFVQFYRSAIIRRFQRKEAKLQALTEFYNKIKDEYEIEMCNCGGIVDLKNPQQVIAKMCEQCLDARA